MFVAPIVVGLSRLVAEREKRAETESDAGRESQAVGEADGARVPTTPNLAVQAEASELEDKTVTTETTASKEKRNTTRKAIQIHRVRRTKAKSKRREGRAISPSPSTEAKCE